jgi:DnaJ-class molecular chaperone
MLDTSELERALARINKKIELIVQSNGFEFFEGFCEGCYGDGVRRGYGGKSTCSKCEGSGLVIALVKLEKEEDV